MNLRTGYDDGAAIKGYLLEMGRDGETGGDVARDLRDLRSIFWRGAPALLEPLWALLTRLGKSGVEGVDETAATLYLWLNAFDGREPLREALWEKIIERHPPDFLRRQPLRPPPTCARTRNINKKNQ